MSQPYFRFQQFTIFHDRCAQRVGTDGVLLGAWADLTAATHILDIGSGSGLVALMAAQRALQAEVVGVEIHQPSVEQSRQNVLASPFADRVEIFHNDIRDFLSPQPFDQILCNPPFHTETTLSPNQARSVARHESLLPFPVLVENVLRLLSADGKFSVIIPFNAAPVFLGLCHIQGLHMIRRCDVRTTATKPFTRSLLTFSLSAFINTSSEVLVLQESDGHRTPEYNQLTSQFYLLR